MHIRKYSGHSLLFIALFIFIGCRKNTTLPMIDSCLEQASLAYHHQNDPNFNCCDCQVSILEVFSEEIPYDYFYPILKEGSNGNKAIVYYRRDNLSPFAGFEVWHSDLCSGQKTLLADNALYGLEWGTDGWVYFTGFDQGVYKVKPNSDSLTRVDKISFGDFNRYPKVSPQGTEILIESEYNGETNVYIYNTIDSTLKTVIEGPSLSAWDWVNDTSICVVYRDGLNQKFAVRNLNTDTEEIYFEIDIKFSTDSFVTQIEYLAELNSIFWCGRGLVGKVDLSTRTNKVIFSAYSHEDILSFGINEEAVEWLVVSKRKMNQIDLCTVDSNFDLILTNINTGNDRKLEL